MSGTFYNAVAIVIFVFVAVNFLFPCNSIMPLGERPTSLAAFKLVLQVIILFCVAMW
jgi:hypothetical protein